MRGLKKLLALLLAVTMIASVLAVPVFADDEDASLSSGAKLELLGLLIGDGDGVTDAYLAKSTTRMQLAILNARWLAYEEDAYDFEDWDDDYNFVDYDDRTSEAEWNMLAYYYADPDLGFIGTGYDVFDPQDKITNKQLAKILLVAMGYPYGDEYDWEDILAFAASLGIPLGNSERGLTNAEMADAIVAALEALTAYGTDDEPMTFAQYLMELGVVTEEDLIAAGIAYIYGEEAPGDGAELPTLEVVSLAANGFAEVEFTFNQKVDPDSTDYAIFRVDNLRTDVKLYVVEDYGDGKVVRAFNPASYVGAQNEYCTIGLVGLKTAGGITMNAFSQQLTFRDSIAPTIDKVVAKGNTRIDIYFSEPLQATDAVKTLSNYQVGNGTLSATAPALNTTADKNTNRIVTIKNIKTKLSAGIYVLGIRGENTNIIDFAGNNLGYQTAEFEIIADTTGPIAQKVVDPKYPYKIMIEFDEEITEDAKLRWVDGSNNRDSEATSVDGNVATFEFKTKNRSIPLAGTTVTLVGAKDYSGNAAQAPLSFEIVPVVDTVRPAIISYGSDAEGEIWIRFNKKIAAGSVDINKWEAKNPDGDRTYRNEWEATVDDTGKKLTLKGKEDSTKMAGVYKLTIKEILDTAMPDANKILDTTIEVDVPDTIAPSIEQAFWGGLKGSENRTVINIFFSEEVDYATAVTRSHYRTRIAGESYKSLPSTTLVGLQNGNRTVTLTFKEAFAAGKVVEVSAIDVEDKDGNRSSDSAVVGSNDAITVDSVEATAKNTIEIKFASALTTYDLGNFLLTYENNVSSLLKGIEVDEVKEWSSDGKKIVLTLSDDLNPTATWDKDKKPVYVFFKDLLGVNNGGRPVVDKIKPTFLKDESYFDYSDDYAPSSRTGVVSMFLVFDEAVKYGTSTNWDGIFQTLIFGTGNEQIVSGEKKEDDYTWTWEADTDGCQSIGKDDYYYVRVNFKVDKNSVKPKFKYRNIGFAYGALKGYEILDMKDNVLPNDAFKDFTLETGYYGFN